MPFFNGSVNLARYNFDYPHAPSAGEILRKVYAHRISPLELNSTASISVGWCKYTTGAEEFVMDDIIPFVGSRDYLFGIRVDEKKVPASTKRRLVKEALEEYKSTNGKKIPKAVKTSIMDEIEHDLLRQAIPVSKVYGVLWSPEKQTLVTEVVSNNVFVHLEKLVLDTFGEHKLEAVNSTTVFKEVTEDAARNFLTWLVYGVSKGYHYDTDYDFEIDSKVKLTATTGTVSEVSIKGGNLSNSNELKQALASGAKVAALRFMFSMPCDDTVDYWSFNLDAKDLWPRSLKMPAVSAPSYDEHNEARIGHMNRVIECLSTLYKEFDSMDADDRGNYAEAFRAWVNG